MYPLVLTIVPNFDPRMSSTFTTTVGGSPESGLTTRGPTPEWCSCMWGEDNRDAIDLDLLEREREREEKEREHIERKREREKAQLNSYSYLSFLCLPPDPLVSLPRSSHKHSCISFDCKGSGKNAWA